MAIGLGAALLGGALLASRNKGGKSLSGYAALPSQLQNVYNRFGQYASQAVPENIYANPRLTQAQQPTSPFDSQALYNLQQALGAESPTQPIGVLEPFSQYQRQALQAYGEPDYSTTGLAQYMQPFESARQRAIENINRQSDINASNVRGREARVGSLARDALYGGQYPQIEEARARALGDLESGITQRALGLRQQSLADMLNAGSAVQQQNQALLNLSQPSQLAQLSPDYAKAQALLPLLSGVPQSGVSTPLRPNFASRLANVGSFMFGPQIAQGLGYGSPTFGQGLGGLF